MNRQMAISLMEGDQTPVILKSNIELGAEVRVLENEDGSICINAEDAAIGLGWYEEKDGKKYPRWRTINGYAHEFGFSQDVAKNDYIPESLFYRLGMKATNSKAIKFQSWLADEVIPEIRRNGMYAFEGISTEMKALLMHDKQIHRVEKRIDELEDNIHISRSQQKQLKQFAGNVVVSALGSKYSNAYKKFAGKAFSSFWHDYYNHFNVSSYLDTPKLQFQAALQFINDWKPNDEMSCLIKGANLGGNDDE